MCRALFSGCPLTCPPRCFLPSQQLFAPLFHTPSYSPGRFTFAGIDVSQQFLDEARANVDAAMAALKSSGSESPSGASGAAAAPSSTSTHTGSISWEVQTVCADYMSGLREVRRRFPAQTLVLLWLGSSVGNLEDPEARAFFRGVLRITGQRTRVLLATDLWKSRGVLQLAYDDPQGVTAAFIKNGLRHALRTLGCSVPEDDRELPWEYEAIVNAEKRRVEMWVRCNQDLEVIPNKVSLRCVSCALLALTPSQPFLCVINFCAGTSSTEAKLRRSLIT